VAGDLVIVYTGGTFDLFHAGHVALLAQCAKLAGDHGEVVVALNSDAFIATYKGRPPVCTYREREVVLEACRWVTRVIPNRMGADSRPTIEEVRPDIVAIGMDWAQRDYYAQMNFTQEWLDKRGISLVYVAHAFSTGLTSGELKVRLNER
jgi:glycerol-3-phosphate cytidylyltransferase